MMTRNLAGRFWAKVDQSGECWEWAGALKSNGYGTLRVKRGGKWRMGYAHRVAYELTAGPIPDGLYVCHRCDNRRCVRPDHLFLGTHQENQADMGRKGRTYSPAKKLSDSEVMEIRALCAAGVRRADIAAQFGVRPSHISRIRLGSRR